MHRIKYAIFKQNSLINAVTNGSAKIEISLQFLNEVLSFLQHIQEMPVGALTTTSFKRWKFGECALRSYEFKKDTVPQWPQRLLMKAVMDYKLGTRTSYQITRRIGAVVPYLLDGVMAARDCFLRVRAESKDFPFLLQVTKNDIDLIIALLERKAAICRKLKKRDGAVKTYTEYLSPLRNADVLTRIEETTAKAARNQAVSLEDYYFLLCYTVCCVVWKNGGRSEIAYKMTNGEIRKHHLVVVDVSALDRRLQAESTQLRVIEVANTKVAESSGFAVDNDDYEKLLLVRQLRNSFFASNTSVDDDDKPFFLTTNGKPLQPNLMKMMVKIEEAANVSDRYGTLEVHRSCATKALLFYINMLSALEDGTINWSHIAGSHTAKTRLRVYAHHGHRQLIANFYALLRVAEEMRDPIVETFEEKEWDNERRRATAMVSFAPHKVIAADDKKIPNPKDPQEGHTEGFGARFSRKWKNWVDLNYPVVTGGWSWTRISHANVIPKEKLDDAKLRKAVWHYFRNRYLAAALADAVR
ncbi:hypothetical protein QR680_019194 [Steinernema hermaphroditum]|uniref:Uncharacterized protein n=1 Tax=Steinernema hermaphroditum TaxID=289476 RepID=A0AA39HL93_9BILA|nr:hypothetical protein QR680_019194 [Steinernema hermaphroditum]